MPFGAQQSEPSLPVVGGQVAADEIASPPEGVTAVQHAPVVEDERLAGREAQTRLVASEQPREHLGVGGGVGGGGRWRGRWGGRWWGR